MTSVECVGVACTPRERVDETGRLLDLLKGIDWARLGVLLVIVHGSVVRGALRPRDVDLVVFAEDGEEEIALKVMEAVEEVLGLEADVYVVTDPGNVNCFLLLEALAHGVIVYQEPRGRIQLVYAVGLCNDFMISRKKVRYTETMVKRVLGNAP